MKPPFGIPPDLAKLAEYLQSTPAERVAPEASAWDVDPIDLITIAEIAWKFHSAEHHALALYEVGLGRAPEVGDPESDRDVGPAYANYAKLLEKVERWREALDAYRQARRHGCDDPFVRSHMAVLLHAAGEPDEARELLRQVVREPPEELNKWMSADAVDSLRQLLAELEREAAPKATLAALTWWFAPEAEKVATALVELSYAQLESKGAPRSLLQAARSAVIFDHSADLKVWHVALFRDRNAQAAVERGIDALITITAYFDPGREKLSGFDLHSTGATR